AVEPTTTMAPADDFSINGSAASQPNTVAITSISKPRRQAFSSMPWANALTLATKMSTPPSAPAASPTQDLSAPRSATSTDAPQALTPFFPSPATASPTGPALRAHNATSQPSSAKSSQMARPMPRVPPVTSAFLPFNPKSIAAPLPKERSRRSASRVDYKA